jgi:hypothetical protein
MGIISIIRSMVAGQVVSATVQAVIAVRALRVRVLRVPAVLVLTEAGDGMAGMQVPGNQVLRRQTGTRSVNVKVELTV